MRVRNWVPLWRVPTNAGVVFWLDRLLRRERESNMPRDERAIEVYERSIQINREVLCARTADWPGSSGWAGANLVISNFKEWRKMQRMGGGR